MLLQLKNVKKAVGAEEILADVSFLIEEKEKVALVGVNGAGKTSVFRIITGEWTADSGDISRRGGTSVGYLPQNSTGSCEQPVEFVNLFDALNAVFLPLKKIEEKIRGLEAEMGKLSGAKLEEALKQYDALSFRFKEEGGFETDSRLKGVLRGLGFPEAQWEQAFSQLSGGERTRAMLGKLLLERNDLLLLDEPTNHLDIESVIWLEDYLKSFPGAVLVISHDRYFLDKIATKTIEIENKKSLVYNGNYTFFVNKKAADRAALEKAYREQQKVLRHHEEAAKTIRSFKTEAAIIRAKSREKLLAKIERVDAPEKGPSHMRLRLTPRIASGNDVLFAEGLTMGFGGKTLFENLHFEIKKGDKTAIIGPNGIGKTTLIKILVGELAPLAGRVREGVNVRVGYYDQAHAFSPESESKTIFQEIADTYPRLTQTQIRTTLAAFMFIGDDVFKPLSALSGGERGRVQLSKIMLHGANFLVLDEPTNHLDIFSKEILEEALREFPGTLIYISHDRYFINNTATKILEMTPSGITEYVGNYDYYAEKKAAQAMVPVEITAAPATAKDDYLRKKEAEAAARRKKSRIEKLEAGIEQTEAQISACDEKLATAEINTNAEAAQAVYTEKTALEEALATLYEEWATLNES